LIIKNKIPFRFYGILCIHIVVLLFFIFTPGPVNSSGNKDGWTYTSGAVTRASADSPKLALIFTADTYGEGGEAILKTLKSRNIKASFFLTGNFLKNPGFKKIIEQIIADGHYVGPHSDRHLSYLRWTSEKTAVSKKIFTKDLNDNVQRLKSFGVTFKTASRWWIPPFERYNEEIAEWSRSLGWGMFNFTPGTVSNFDYTTNRDRQFVSSRTIYQSIEQQMDNGGLNGFILLLHLGAGPKRDDKFHVLFPALIDDLISHGYSFERIDELLQENQ